MHPYFKLNYVNQNWAGEEEFNKTREDGDPDACNWQAEARMIVEKMVHTDPSADLASYTWH